MKQPKEEELEELLEACLAEFEILRQYYTSPDPLLVERIKAFLKEWKVKVAA